MASTINESVIASNILGCFGLSNIEQYRTVSHVFNDTITDLLSDVTVVAPCGLYKKNGQYYLPGTDKKFMKGIIIKDDGNTIYFQKKVMTIDVTILKLPKINALVSLGPNTIWEHIGNEIRYVGFGMENISSVDLVYLKNICFRSVKQCNVIVTEVCISGNYANRNVNFDVARYGDSRYENDLHKMTTKYSLLVTDDHVSIKSTYGPRLLTKYLEYINYVGDAKEFHWRLEYDKIVLNGDVASFIFFDNIKLNRMFFNKIMSETALAHCGLYKKDGRLCIPDTDIMFSESVTAKNVGLMVHLSKRVAGYSFDIFKMPKTNNLVKFGDDIYMKVIGSMHGEPEHENDINFVGMSFGKEKYVEDKEACELLRHRIMSQIEECDIKVTSIGVHKNDEYWIDNGDNDEYDIKRGRYYIFIEHVNGPQMLADFMKHFSLPDTANINVHDGCAYF